PVAGALGRDFSLTWPCWRSLAAVRFAPGAFHSLAPPVSGGFPSHRRRSALGLRRTSSVPVASCISDLPASARLIVRRFPLRFSGSAGRAVAPASGRPALLPRWHAESPSR